MKISKQDTDMRAVRKRLSQAAMDLETSNAQRQLYTALVMIAVLVFLYGSPEMYLPPGDPLREGLQPAFSLYAWGRLAVMFAPLISLAGFPRDAELPERAKQEARLVCSGSSVEQAVRLAGTCEQDTKRNWRQVRIFTGLMIAGLTATMAAKIMALRIIVGA